VKRNHAGYTSLPTMVDVPPWYTPSYTTLGTPLLPPTSTRVHGGPPAETGVPR